MRMKRASTSIQMMNMKMKITMEEKNDGIQEGNTLLDKQ